MNVVVPGLKDRRVAEAGGNLTSKNGSQSKGEVSCNGNDNDCDKRDLSFRRITDIDAIVLEQNLDRPKESQSKEHATAHFVISAKGDILYTRDISSADKNIANQSKILIQFQDSRQQSAGHPQNPGLSREAIIAGRRLVSYFSSCLPKLKYISLRDKLEVGDRVANQDLWVNIGAWAVEKLPLERSRLGYLPQPRLEEQKKSNNLENKASKEKKSWPSLANTYLGARP